MSDKNPEDAASKNDTKIPSLASCARLEDIELVGCGFELLNRQIDHAGKVVMSLSLDSKFSEGRLRLIGTVDADIKGVSDDEKETVIFTLTVKKVATYSFSEIHPWADKEIDHFSMFPTMFPSTSSL
jgi:hypothetical protein